MTNGTKRRISNQSEPAIDRCDGACARCSAGRRRARTLRRMRVDDPHVAETVALGLDLEPTIGAVHQVVEVDHTEASEASAPPRHHHPLMRLGDWFLRQPRRRLLECAQGLDRLQHIRALTNARADVSQFSTQSRSFATASCIRLVVREIAPPDSNHIPGDRSKTGLFVGA
jgi:hypothetical protein